MEFRPQGPWCFHPSHVGIPDSIRASAEPSRGGSEPEPVPLSDVGTLGCLTGPRVHHPSSIYGVGLQPYLLRYLDSKLTSNTFLRSYRLEPGHRVTGVTGQSPVTGSSSTQTARTARIRPLTIPSTVPSRFAASSGGPGGGSSETSGAGAPVPRREREAVGGRFGVRYGWRVGGSEGLKVVDG